MSSDLVWAMVRMLVTLPLVLGLVYLVLKYGLSRRYVTASGNRRMKLVEQLPLGPKSTLSLVTMGGVYYLLAHQENSISLVKELGELPELEDVKIADVMEITPHSVKEYDQLKVPGGEYGEIKAHSSAGEIFVLMLKKVAGQAVQTQKAVMARVTNRTVNDDKGGKKIEG
jgi:flagellar protein FliO/FliZ